MFKEKRTVIFIVLVFVVFLSARYFQCFDHTKPSEVYHFPEKIGIWQGHEIDHNSEQLSSWLSTENIVFRQYRSSETNTAVSVYIGYYRDLESSNMAHSPEVCYAGQGWKVLSQKSVQVAFASSKAKVKRMTVQKGREREVVYSWWQTGDGVYPNNYWYHLHQFLKKLALGETSSIWVRVSAVTAGSGFPGAPEENAIRAFCMDAAPHFFHYFDNR